MLARRLHSSASRMSRGMEASVAPVASFDEIYRGKVLVFRQLAPVQRLVSHAQRSLATALAHPNPPESPSTSPDEVASFVEQCGAACDTFNADPAAEVLWRGVVEAVCGEARSPHVFWDCYKLRCSPVAAATARWDKTRLHAASPTQSVLPPHRDTWGSCCHAQINWWAPIFPVASDRTLELFPSHFTTVVPNTSGEWTVKQFTQWRKSLAEAGEFARGSDPDPAATQPPDQNMMLPTVVGEGRAGEGFGGGEAVVVEPGDLVLFSAAHLHRSIPNTSNLHRFSTEVRTVFLPDVQAGVGAPNVDCAVDKPPKLNWFHSLEDRRVKASDVFKNAE
eukprot:m.216875 g.216875  ORF g.216875 m.216875 type:complete len:335 (+) comp25663_c1_seq2:8391-9395(+)